MPPLPRDDQARLLLDIADVFERKRKLEDHIRKVDSLNNSLLESAVHEDIEAYKSRSPLPKLARYLACELEPGDARMMINIKFE